MMLKNKDIIIVKELNEKDKLIKVKDNVYATEIFEEIPIGYIDGCGLTSVALESKNNVIVAVPSLTLVENKYRQYPNKLIKCHSRVDIDLIKKQISLKEGPIKIITTYDSLFKLESLIDTYNFKIVIDKSDQLLHTDSSHLNKKNTNDIPATDYIWNLLKKYKHKISFISATPIDRKYFPEFISEIPFIKFDQKEKIKRKPIPIKYQKPGFIIK